MTIWVDNRDVSAAQAPIAGVPRTEIPVPDAVQAIADGDRATAVWRNVCGGVTFRIGPEHAARCFVKWAPAELAGTPEGDFTDEAARLRWVGSFVTVPAVLEMGRDDAGSWLVTSALNAFNAADRRWQGQPSVAARSIGFGLRRLHDLAPVDRCPFTWSVDDRKTQVHARLTHGEGPSDWAPEHRHLAISEAREILSSPPPVDKLVVCHGDACAPNTLLDENGFYTAHVDLGSLGVADRWADLAVAAWSLEWNFHLPCERALFEGYGIQHDSDRLAYYRLLWDLS
ncbi:aminoglycoside 3'-phosphotransferase [Gordonia jinhuaensis]|uniref:Phosphotransferase n=1 Tax=Gordonia jinhuaensis TaxID=1517702 RepID=A0A916SZ34_9ACTN|nr:putative phosphotransferase [Gordonia jinhuaensis]